MYMEYNFENIEDTIDFLVSIKENNNEEFIGYKIEDISLNIDVIRED